MGVSSDRLATRSEGFRSLVPVRSIPAHARTRDDYTERSFRSLRKLRAMTSGVGSTPLDAIHVIKARFLLGDLVCGGRQREGSPFCGARNG